MRRFTLKVLGLVAALAGVLPACAQDSEVTETLYPTCDVQVRSDSKNYKKADGTAIEMRNTVDDEGTVTGRFAGLMSFSVPAKAGYSVKSATLRLITERVKSGGLAIYTFGGAISSSDTYGTQEDNINAALENDAIVSQKLNGVSGRAAFDSQAEGTTYDDWKNELDITSTVQALTGNTLNLLLCNNTTTKGKEGVNVYTSEASATTLTSLPKFTFEENALRPQLTIVYEIDEAQKVESVYPSYDVQVRANAETLTSATSTTLEMYTTVKDGETTHDFLGLIAFDIPSKPGYTIQSATLRLITERIKGGRSTVRIYGLDQDVTSETTYADLKDAITAARSGNPIVEQVLKGAGWNMAAFDDGAEGSTYDDWKNEIDLTAYVQSLSGTDVNLLLANAKESGEASGVNVYSNEASATTLTRQPKFTFEEDALRPMLTIVYTKTTDGIDQIEEAAAHHDGAIYTISGIRVNKPLQKGIYIQNGKKFIVR